MSTKTKKSRSAPNESPTLPAPLNLTATAHIELEAGGDGESTALPRFQMVARAVLRPYLCSTTPKKLPSIGSLNGVCCILHIL